MKLKTIVVVFLIIVLIIIMFGLGVVLWYNTSLKPVNTKKVDNDSYIEIEIENGMVIAQIANLLEEKNAIKSGLAMRIYCKLNNISDLKAGKYKIDTLEDMPVIIEHLINGDIADSRIKITFIEGKNMRNVAKKIAENTKKTEEDVFNLLKNEEYIDSLIEKYWFLTDEIKDDRIYYPLEGYLLPETYYFESEDVSVKTIFNVMLNEMDKFLSEYKDNIPNNLTIHQMLTMASIAELEGKSDEDRAEIIGVFFNRIYSKMSLGSDVTTYYAFKVDMGDRNLTQKEINTENPYNTRGPNMSGKIPVGPISNPSKSAILSTINYKETDAYYFVADKNGKVYFTKNNSEHNNMIYKLKKEGLWFTYE